MTDEEFRKQHQPLHVATHIEDTDTITDQVVFALADLGEGSPDAIARHLEELMPNTNAKVLIAETHRILSELQEQGRIAATDKDGTFIYNLHKVTEANDGAVSPDLLAPGLD